MRAFNVLEWMVSSSAVWQAANVLVDRYYGLETFGNVALKDLGVPHEERVHYAPSGWFTIQRIGRIIEFRPDDVFVDFGSGKGRVLLMAARYYPFKRVMGVEIAAGLNDVARSNVERNLKRLRCRRVELVTSDALCFAPPDDMTIAYFYSPFYGSIFSRVVENIRLSWLERTNRRLWVVLLRPLDSPNKALYEANHALLASSSWLKLKETAATRTHIISVYQAVAI
jgi:SAM-dependent methyltransferase